MRALDLIAGIFIAITILAFSTGSLAQYPSTTLANNSSTCDEDQLDVNGGICWGKFVGMSDSVSGYFNAGAILSSGSPFGLPLVSDLDIHRLLYPGNQTFVLAHYQPWFAVCNQYSPDNNQLDAIYPTPSNPNAPYSGPYKTCNGHVETGYPSNNYSTGWGQMADLQARGFNGVIIDWYGSKPGIEGSVTAKIRDYLQSTACQIGSCPLRYALMEDQGSWDRSGACPHGASNQTTCIINHIDADLDLASTSYFSYADPNSGNNFYLKISSTGPASSPWQYSPSGRPVFFFFVNEGNWPNVNWLTVWNSVAAHVDSYGANTPYFIFRNTGGFSHADTFGGYAWENQNSPSSSDPSGLHYLSYFYQVGSQSNEPGTMIPMPVFGAAWKGFDATWATWMGGAPIMAQRCGQHWLDTFAAPAQYFGTSKQLPFLQVVTWNDYDEGTEFESGIENCWIVSANISGRSLVDWTISPSTIEPNASTYATENTVDHYEVWVSNDANDDEYHVALPVGSRSYDLSSFHLASGEYEVQVLQVSKPSIRNQISGVLHYVQP